MRHAKWELRLPLWVGALVVGAVLVRATAPEGIGWDLISSGGGEGRAGEIVIQDSLGQPMVSGSSAGEIQLESGFWAYTDVGLEPTPTGTRPTPTVTATRTTSPTSTLTGTPTMTATQMASPTPTLTGTPTSEPTGVSTASPTASPTVGTPAPTRTPGGHGLYLPLTFKRR